MKQPVRLADRLARSSFEFRVVEFERFELEICREGNDQWCFTAIGSDYEDTWHGYSNPGDARRAFERIFLGGWRGEKDFWDGLHDQDDD